jgi:alkylation response protein AidB-like acyl-CoA dehydrogenase
MEAIFTEQQKIIINTAKKMAENGLDDGVNLINKNHNIDQVLFTEWSGLGIPEENGGLGGGIMDLALLFQELSTKLIKTNFFNHAIGLQVAHASGISTKDALLNNEKWCIIAESDSSSLISTKINIKNNRLIGSYNHVLDGDVANKVIIVGVDKIILVAPIDCKISNSSDLIQSVASLEFDSEILDQGSTKNNPLLNGLALSAAKLCGIARGAIDLAVDYANHREQFGRKIGSFQGVAHQLAEAEKDLQTSISLMLYSCWSVEGKSTINPHKYIHAAKANASIGAILAAETSIQVHGGMGMTFETPAHLYLRQALSNAAQFGSYKQHFKETAKITMQDK